MTKRLSIALIAAALFVVLAVLPVSASTVNPNNYNGTVIDAGATVFIGEQGLNLTRAMNQADYGYSQTGSLGRWLYNAPTNTTIAWWASGSTSQNPDYSVDVQAKYTNFQVDQDTFVGRTGNWYLISSNGNTVTKMGAVMNVLDPSVSVAVWDWSQNGKDVTGLNVVRGEHLAVKVNTNMYAATYASRNNTIWEVTPVVSTTAGVANMMPDGTVSTWNFNRTGLITGGVSSDYAVLTLVNPGVYQVTNYSYLASMTYSTGQTDSTFGANAWCNSSAAIAITGGGTPIYWNNSAVDWNYPYTGKNYTASANGLTAYTGAWQLGAAGACYGTPTVKSPTRATDGFMNLKVKDESGAVLSKLWVGKSDSDTDTTSTGTGANLTAITYQFVDTQPWYFGTQYFKASDSTNPGYWVTDKLVNGQYAYATGTYQIWAESVLNNMKDNYRSGGADYTGHTVSAVGTVTLISDTVKIEANKDSVVRSKSFSVTVTGKAQTTYYVWVKDTSTMTGGYDDQAPYITDGQDKVYFDCAAASGASTLATCAGLTTTAGANPAHPIGNYTYDNGNGNTIWDNVAGNTTDGASVFKARYYALINTTTTGTRSVGFTTTNWTKAQKYTIRVEQNMPTTLSGYGAAQGAAGSSVKSDEVDINVEKGAVTIVAAGDGTYYLGDEIKLSGTNTETTETYLFLIGPNLPTDGAKITDADPRHAGTKNPGITNGNVADFKVVDVQGDNTWSWKWGTAGYALDGGPYTIYAVSQPSDKQSDHLAKAAYNTVSITIKKPFVSATASQSTVAKGDKLYITGTAQGNPDSVRIWIMGKNLATVSDESVNSDGSFSYEIKKETTKDWASGQYFVVVQHPMQNKQYDVYLSTAAYGTDNYGWVINRLLTATTTTTSTGGSRIFKLLGSNSLQGSDAAKALADGIDNANVDDTYTKLQFLVEEPKITIDTVGDKHVGDKFTITASTNLAVDDEVLVQVYSSSFKPTQKSQSGEYSGATGTRKVTKGDSGMNKISFDVDSSTFKPDEYIVTEDAVLQSATANTLFNVLEPGTKPVATTAVVTTAPVQTTAQQTVVQTTVATPVPTTTKPSPGFGALIALIGLGAVAFVVVRRH